MKSVLWPLLRSGLSRVGHLARSDGLGPVPDAEATDRIIEWLAGSLGDRPIGVFSGRPIRAGLSRRPAGLQHLGMSVVTSIAVLMLLCGVALAVPPGTEIPNTALATYDFGTLAEIESPSNTVIIVTTGARTPSTLEFMHYAPGCPQAETVRVPVTHYSATGTRAGPFVPLPFESR
ncbi:hypothetical protein ACFL2Z_04485 [Candidatus Eisenbacteria bacterium]|uniref:Uncharacterized protein n=1 Tax=Eiseniibacteriota bacterium TaxID=2212470 RepID=A0ABV6YQ07_UNCEI